VGSGVLVKTVFGSRGTTSRMVVGVRSFRCLVNLGDPPHLLLDLMEHPGSRVSIRKRYEHPVYRLTILGTRYPINTRVDERQTV
jgi:hypothetical protein